MKHKKLKFLVICLFLIWSFIYFLPILVGRIVPDMGASSLMYALQKNHIARAKLLVNSKQWAYLDEWGRKHTATRCKLLGWNRSSVIYSQPDQTHWIGSFSLACETDNYDGFYCMYEEKISSVRTKLGWEVVDWSPILEGTKRDECIKLPIEDFPESRQGTASK